MDSYAVALKQVADQQNGLSTSTPPWLDSANAAASRHVQSSQANSEHDFTAPRNPPPKPPPKSNPRVRPSFTRLESVLEEPGREASPPNCPAPSVSGASTSSASDSVRTAIYSPPRGTASYRGSSSGSGNESGSSSSHASVADGDAQRTLRDKFRDAQTTSVNNSKSPSQQEDRPLVHTDSSSKDSEVLSKLHSEPTARAKANTPPDTPSVDSFTDTDKESMEQSSQPAWEQTISDDDAAPPPVVPRTANSEAKANQSTFASHLKSTTHALKAKLKPLQPRHSPSTSHQQESQEAEYETRIEAIDGMLESLGPPQIGLAVSCNTAERPSSRTDRQTISQEGQRSRRPDPQTRETTRDGVPIHMREKSGVWVESVEGADLTSSQDQQKNVPKGQPIAEREAEDIPNIKIPKDPWNNLPPYITLENGTSKADPSAPRPTTRSQREQATASWARAQARLQDHPQPRQHAHRRTGSDDPDSKPRKSREHARLQTPVELRRSKSNNNNATEAPFYHEDGQTFHNSNKPANTDPSRDSPVVRKSSSSSDKASGPRSSPNTSLTTDAPDPLPPRTPARNKTPAPPPKDIQAKIAASAAAAEQLIYGLPPPRKRGIASRFESIELV